MFLTVHQIVVQDYKTMLQKNQNDLYDYRSELIKETYGVSEDISLAEKTYERTKNELDKKPLEIYQNQMDALLIKIEISESFIKDANHKKNLFNKEGIEYFNLIKKQSFIKIKFTALCSEVIFCVFSEKKSGCTFQNWTFSECPFLGYTKHFFILCFF